MKKLNFQTTVSCLTMLATWSCSIYDAELLANAEGEENIPISDAPLATPAAGGTIPVDEPQDDSGTGGGTVVALMHEEDRVPGAGGTVQVMPPPREPCDGAEKISPSPPTWVEVVEHFNHPFRTIGDNTTFTGSWYASHDATAESISPVSDTWSYERHECMTETDTSLHVVGQGVAWASYDATLMDGALPVNREDADGIRLWATSPVQNRIRVGFLDTSGMGHPEVPLFLTEWWEEYRIPFPSSFDRSNIVVVQVVAVGGTDIDLWVDDLSFFSE